MELQMAVEPIHVSRRHDLRLVERLYLLQRLQHRLVRREHERVVAKALFLRILVRKKEFVEDARRHQDGLPEPHRERIDVVRVGGGSCLHTRKRRLELLGVNRTEKVELVNLQAELAATVERTFAFVPVPEDVRKAHVVAILLEEHVHLQRLELRTTQKGIRSLLAGVVVVEELARERRIDRTDLLPVLRIELPEIVVERNVRKVGGLLLRHYFTSISNDSARRSVIFTRIVPASSGIAYSPFTNALSSGTSTTEGVKTAPS